MRGNYFRALTIQVVLLTTLCLANANAEEYKISLSGEKAFGLSLTSPMKDYINVLGKPDGTINMGKDRIGLVYGQKLLIIFWNNKLWEICVWNTPPIHAFGYIRYGKDQDKFNIVIDGNIRLGMVRKKVLVTVKSLIPHDMEGDEYSSAFIYNNTTVVLEFKYRNSEQDTDLDNQILSAIQVSFEANNPNISKNK